MFRSKQTSIFSGTNVFGWNCFSGTIFCREISASDDLGRPKKRGIVRNRFICFKSFRLNWDKTLITIVESFFVAKFDLEQKIHFFISLK